MVRTVVEPDLVIHHRIGPPMLTRMMEMLLVIRRIEVVLYICVMVTGGGLNGGMEATIMCYICAKICLKQ